MQVSARFATVAEAQLAAAQVVPGTANDQLVVEIPELQTSQGCEGFGSPSARQTPSMRQLPGRRTEPQPSGPQVSAVQARPSSQATSSGVERQRSPPSSQLSVVQAMPSLQSLGPEGRQAPLEQLSPTVQKAPSEQRVPSAVNSQPVGLESGSQ